jgi:hypothetical protein
MVAAREVEKVKAVVREKVEAVMADPATVAARVAAEKAAREGAAALRVMAVVMRVEDRRLKNHPP